MLTGRFPGMQEALDRRVEEIRQDGRKLATRRAILAGFAGVTLGACAGGGAVHMLSGQAAEPVKTNESSPELEKLRAMASGPLERLVPYGGEFLTDVANLMPQDETVWSGVGRLAYAVAEQDPRANRMLRPLLLTLSERPGVPSYMRPWFDLLRSSRR